MGLLEEVGQWLGGPLIVLGLWMCGRSMEVGMLVGGPVVVWDWSWIASGWVGLDGWVYFDGIVVRWAWFSTVVGLAIGRRAFKHHGWHGRAFILTRY